MEGITYINDEKSQKKFVQIDLDKYGELWQDFLDVIIAQSRKDDKKVSFKEVKAMVFNGDL